MRCGILCYRAAVAPLAALLLAALCDRESMGDVVYTSSTRTVQAHAHIGQGSLQPQLTDTQADSAPMPTGPWNRTVSVNVTPPPDPFGVFRGVGDATVTMLSNVGPSGIVGSATGSSASAPHQNDSMGSASASWSALFDIAFTLDSPTAAVLSVDVEAHRRPSQNEAVFMLSGGDLPQPLVLALPSFPELNTLSLNWQGTLGPGNYHLWARAVGFSFVVTDNYTDLEFALQIPSCPAAALGFGALGFVSRRPRRTWK